MKVKVLKIETYKFKIHIFNLKLNLKNNRIKMS